MEFTDTFLAMMVKYSRLLPPEISAFMLTGMQIQKNHRTDVFTSLSAFLGLNTFTHVQFQGLLKEIVLKISNI